MQFSFNLSFQELVQQRNERLANSTPSVLPDYGTDEESNEDDMSYYQTFMGLNYGALSGLLLDVICYYYQRPPFLVSCTLPIHFQYLILSIICASFGALIGYFLDSSSSCNFPSSSI
jgi:hypothetical protein